VTSGWQKRGWTTSTGSPVKHRDLWEALIAEEKQRPIQWTLERGQPPSFARGLDKLASDSSSRL
jgi:ribonuclease HI